MLKLLLLSFLLLFSATQSVNAYSIEDVIKHNTSSDCWVIFEEGVYDLTDYLYQHDAYLDIREWCGEDITLDFMTKNQTGRDHKGSSYLLLEEYRIGEINTKDNPILIAQDEDNITELDNQDEKNTRSNPYNIVVPLLLSLSLYWIPYFIIKKKNPMSIKKFNAFWNTLLIFLLLIPAFGFGMYMILRYRFPNLWNINFDFMYWHVELSLVMGILGINHFLQRFKIYFSQLRKNT